MWQKRSKEASIERNIRWRRCGNLTQVTKSRERDTSLPLTSYTVILFFLFFFTLPSHQMHRTRKMIIAKLKSVLCFMRLSSPRRKEVNVYQISHPCTATQVQSCPREVYLPGHLWDALNPTERFASVADLCAHIGDQLPIQVVKLIARDVLRGLEDFHSTRGVAHNGKCLDVVVIRPQERWTTC